MQENEPDIFEQLFQQETALLDETPPPQLWERLEKRLDAPMRPKRRPPLLQLPVTISIFFVLMVSALLAWLSSHQHEARLKGQKQWAAIAFMAGNWVCDTNKTHIVLNFNQKDQEPLLFGQRETFFKGEATGATTLLFLLKNHQLELIVSEKVKNGVPRTDIFKLQSYDSKSFIFKNDKNKDIAMLEVIGNQSFRLQLGFGNSFVFKR
jgi:hypothetical protein